VDTYGSCREVRCGARGGFHGEAFARSAKRTILYIDRLKRSREYRESVAALMNRSEQN